MADASHCLCNLSLKLSNCERLEYVEYVMNLEKLTSLEELILQSVPSLKSPLLGISGPSVLKKLTITNVGNPFAEGQNASSIGDWLKMTCLTSLTFATFHVFKELLPSLSQLPALEKMLLGAMPELALSAKLFRIPRLRSLVLVNLQGVKALPEEVD